MGAGGQMSVPPKAFPRFPHEKPPFTLSDLKKAIPPHCFKRSLVRSVAYLMRDLFIASLFFYIANTYFHLLPKPLAYVAWPLYWLCQGAIQNGLWVLGHECGHHAFSDYQWIDDTIGLILHSSLLVPYFSWKYSHRRHHSNTNSIDDDEVYVPKFKSETSWFFKHMKSKTGRAIFIFVLLTVGWPMYLFLNFLGKSYDRFACHFDPYSPIYSPRERAQVLLSDAGFLAVSYVLYRLVVAKGLTWVFFMYGAPLLVTNGFLIMTTFLQHKHPSLPHYDSSEWDWLRGALASVDRNYGILNNVFHSSSDNHLGHHLFPTISHYHLKEVTKAIKPVLGKYYRFDGTPFYKALWREVTQCIYVEPDEDSKNKGVFWYNNKI